MFETWEDTVMAAKTRARANERGYAYAVQWPDKHFTVEDNRPLLRNRDFRVLECDDMGTEYWA